MTTNQPELINVFYNSIFMFRVYDNDTVHIWTDIQENYGRCWTDCKHFLGVYSLPDAREFYRNADYHAHHLITL